MAAKKPKKPKNEGPTPPIPPPLCFPWDVRETTGAAKGLAGLPPLRSEDYKALVRDLKVSGPRAGGKAWPNFSQLHKLKNKELEKRLHGKKMYHCHLNKGKPTYVVVWAEFDKIAKQIIILYIGTHEKAPY